MVNPGQRVYILVLILAEILKLMMSIATEIACKKDRCFLYQRLRSQTSLANLGYLEDVEYKLLRFKMNRIKWFDLSVKEVFCYSGRYSGGLSDAEGFLYA